MISFLSVFPPFRGGIANFSDHLFKELDKQVDTRCYNFKKLYPPLLFPGTNQFDLESQADYALPLSVPTLYYAAGSGLGQSISTQ